MSSFFAESTEFIIRVTTTELPPRPKFDLERSGHSTRDQINDSSLAAKDLGLPSHFRLEEQGTILKLGRYENRLVHAHRAACGRRA